MLTLGSTTSAKFGRFWDAREVSVQQRGEWQSGKGSTIQLAGGFPAEQGHNDCSVRTGWREQVRGYSSSRAGTCSKDLRTSVCCPPILGVLSHHSRAQHPEASQWKAIIKITSTRAVHRDQRGLLSQPKQSTIRRFQSHLHQYV